MHCDVISMIFAYFSKQNFSKKKKNNVNLKLPTHVKEVTNNLCKRSYQPILRYLYTETIKRWGEISLHKHFKILTTDYEYMQNMKFNI